MKIFLMTKYKCSVRFTFECKSNEHAINKFELWLESFLANN